MDYLKNINWEKLCHEKYTEMDLWIFALTLGFKDVKQIERGIKKVNWYAKKGKKVFGDD